MKQVWVELGVKEVEIEVEMLEKVKVGGMSFKNLNIRLLFLQGWGWL